eukprot:gene14118-18944_t
MNGYEERPVTSGGVSTTSSGAGTKRRKKRTIIPISLEEVFNEVSNVTSSNLNPPPGKILLTPRSAEVCLKLGINPEILKIRDIDSFWETGVDPAVQRIRHEAYVQRRYDTMKQCRLERKRMAAAEFEASTSMKNGATVETLTPEMILQQQKEQNSTLIQLELQRIAKMQKRQQKELETMIQFEANRVKIQQEMEKRIEHQKKKDELRKKKQEKRVKLMAEERRLRELQKIALEEAEEENRRNVAREMHEKEQALAEERAKKLVEDKKRAQELELERKIKNDEHKRQVAQFFAEEQMQLRQRLESMQYAEKKKQDAILSKQRKHMEDLRIKREAIEKRIEENMEMAKAMEEKRKTDFMNRQENFEKKREDHMRQQEQERELKAQEIMLQEQRRRMILLQQQKEEEHKAALLLKQFDEDQQHVAEIQAIRDRENQIHKEKKVLRTQMKLENVQRVLRIDDYKRMGTLKKIEDTDSRVKSLVDQKRSLIEERRRAARETKIQKESIAKVMEEVRTNASKANKIITQALSGKITLDSLLKSNDSNQSLSRSTSAKKRRSKKDKQVTTSATMLGLNNRSSISAGNEGLSANNSTVMDGQLGNTAGTNNGAQIIYSASESAKVQPKPYVS